MPSNRPMLGIAEASDHVRDRSFPEATRDLTGVKLEWLVLGEVAGQCPSREQLDGLVLPGGSALSADVESRT